MGKLYWWVLASLFLLVFVPILFFKIPFSGNEIRESYTAYSLIKTGKDTNGKIFPLLFKADGDYLSTLGVYLRIPTVYLFGLDSPGVRAAALPVGAFGLFSFYLILRKIFKNKNITGISLLLFCVSPLFIKTLIFSPGTVFTLSLILLSVSYWIDHKSHRKLLLKIILFLSAIFVIYVIRFEPGFIKFIKRESIISNILPSSYSFEIDKRLSFGKIYGSPLIKQKFNFNRIAFNKIYYGANSIFKSLIYPFDFERWFSPFQSQTIIAEDGGVSKVFPSFYFWELPVIFGGLLLFLKREKMTVLYFLLSIIPVIFFNNYFILLLPLSVICESLLLSYIFQRLKNQKIALAFVLIIYFSGLLIYLSLLKNNSNLWLSENDYQQNKIWDSITPTELWNDNIMVTDRYGEPVFYFLFYEKVDPGYFQANKVNGPIINGAIQRIERVGNVMFRSFNYSNEIKSKNQIWVGAGWDFGDKDNELKIVKT